MSLLTIVQRFAEEVNVNTPTTVLGTTDPQVKQIKALLQKEGADLSGRGDWEVLVNEAKWTWIADETGTVGSAVGTVVGVGQATTATAGDYIYNTTTGASTLIVSLTIGNIVNTEEAIFTTGDSWSIIYIDSIDNLATNNFRYIRNDTIWDRDLRLPVYVVDPTDWQQIRATQVTGPRFQARIMGNDLMVNPPPTIGNTWAFEYVTWNWITDSTGATHKQYFTQDTDETLLPEFILEAGLMWRWKKEKGLEYSEDFRTYELLVFNALSRNGMKRAMNMGQSVVTPKPKVFIPNGSWNV